MTLLTVAAVVLLSQPAISKAAQKPAAPSATDLSVTVTYKGKGAIDETHRVIVWLFSNPEITSQSRPLEHQYVGKSGETITFKNVGSPVYLFAVYDDKGGYDGVSGPPPAGIPCATYRSAPKGPPTAAKPGSAVKFAFDDSERWAR